MREASEASSGAEAEAGTGTGTDFSHWEQLLREIYSNKRWLLAGDVLVPFGKMAHSLEELGAESLFLIAAARGTGPFDPPPIVAGYADLQLPKAPGGVMGNVRAAAEALQHLPAELLAQIEAFDPAREALALGPIFDDGRPVAGRAKFGARPPAWQALEDKIVIDALWEDVGLAHAPYQVLANEAGALEQAFDTLAGPQGVVVAQDNLEGWHGGAHGTHWVPKREALPALLAKLAGHAKQLRVMPFLEGLPCSIHGLVFSDYVAALRPCEMLVLRDPARARFSYQRAATYWDPAPAVRRAMRAAVKQVGQQLARDYNYRGPFTLDGVCTAKGFLPTELNPRFGAALGAIAQGADFALDLLCLGLSAGLELDWQPQALEASLLQAADQHRFGRAGGVVDVPTAQEKTLSLVYDLQTGLTRAATAEEAPSITATLGPAPAGGFLNLQLEAKATPVGPSSAPRVASALRYLDQAWGLNQGHLEPAT